MIQNQANNIKVSVKDNQVITKVGVVVLNWNGKSDTLVCLEELSKSECESQCLLVVDNGSTDGSVNAIMDWGQSKEWGVHVFDEISDNAEQDQKLTVYATNQLFLLKLKENRGYTGGNNAGITWLLNHGAEAIFILNNDSVVYPNAIRIMVSILQQRKDIGIVGCKLINLDKPGGSYEGGNLSYWLGVHFLRRLKGLQKQEVEVNFVPGCAMLVRASVIKTVGGFREDFFLYADDIEFCYRVHQAGWKIVTALGAQIATKVGGSSGGGRTAIYYYFITRNTLVFITEELEGMQKSVALFTFCLARVLQVQVWLFQRRWDRIKGVVKGFSDFLQGVRGPGWARRHLSEHAESSSQPK